MQRRDFIKATALGSAVVAVGGVAALAEPIPQDLKTVVTSIGPITVSNATHCAASVWWMSEDGLVTLDLKAGEIVKIPANVKYGLNIVTVSPDCQVTWGTKA